MDQIPEPIKRAIDAGDAAQQPRIDENTAKLGWLGLVSTPTGLAALAAILGVVLHTVSPYLRGPDSVQKVEIVNWPEVKK